MPENDSASERWLPIDGWPGYEISNAGRLRSWKKSRRHPDEALPRILSTYTLPRGYRCVKLKDRGRKWSAYIHRLVLSAFVGTAPAGQECRHLNGDPADNRLTNLAWGTKRENQTDIDRHGNRVKGERQHCAMSENTARGLLAHPGSHADAARAFGVRYHAAYNIRTRRTWRHL
jgi:hypothetical protein